MTSEDKMADVDFDLIVIGAGPGGYVAAIRAAQLGLKVACVEKRETLGGTCLNVGCIPSKALLHASHFYDEAHEGVFEKFGISFKGVTVDVAKMQTEKTKAVGELTGGIAFLFKKNKVEWIKGTAKFSAANTLDVALNDGKKRKLNAKNILIATGSDVSDFPGVTIDEKVIVSSTGALELAKAPDHLVVIGGGYIGLELGSVWRRLGSHVTVIEYLDRVAATMDTEVGKAFQKSLEKQGMVIKTSTKVTAVKTAKAGAIVTVEPTAGGKSEDIKCDIVLMSVGRKPHTQSLGLDAIGIKLDERGRIAINADFSTNIRGVWAIGDCVPGPMLAHKAEDEGVAAAENIAGLNGHVNHDVIPAVVYTMPEVASVGKTEEELKAANVAYKVGKFPFMANSRAKTNRDTEGFVKVLADAKTDRVLGVHIIGSMAGTMIAQAAQAMEFGASAEDIAMTCHAHPTHSEALKEAAMAVSGRAIHI
jgi:dihydrolipoamide dehydrogenase